MPPLSLSVQTSRMSRTGSAASALATARSSEGARGKTRNEHVQYYHRNLCIMTSQGRKTRRNGKRSLPDDSLADSPRKAQKRASTTDSQSTLPFAPPPLSPPATQTTLTTPTPCPVDEIDDEEELLVEKTIRADERIEFQPDWSLGGQWQLSRTDTHEAQYWQLSHRSSINTACNWSARHPMACTKANTGSASIVTTARRPRHPLPRRQPRSQSSTCRSGTISARLVSSTSHRNQPYLTSRLHLILTATSLPSRPSSTTSFIGLLKKTSPSHRPLATAYASLLPPVALKWPH